MPCVKKRRTPNLPVREASVPARIRPDTREGAGKPDSRKAAGQSHTAPTGDSWRIRRPAGYPESSPVFSGRISHRQGDRTPGVSRCVPEIMAHFFVLSGSGSLRAHSGIRSMRKTGGTMIRFPFPGLSGLSFILPARVMPLPCTFFPQARPFVRVFRESGILLCSSPELWFFSSSLVSAKAYGWS